MHAEQLRERRDAIIDEHGQWITTNVHLGSDVYTMDRDQVGTNEFLVHAVVQLVADTARKPLSELRVLDLACGEGAYSIEFALQGATVVGVEGRLANVAKGAFVASALGLDNVQFIQGDVREISQEQLGRFDVVLCLGILYHLEAADAVRLLQQCHELCDDLAVIRTAIGLSPDFVGTFGTRTYRGRRYRENIRERHAALDNLVSIMPTRAALVNMLADAGFTSVVELRHPPVPGLDEFIDSTTLAAFHREVTSFRSVPALDSVLPTLRRRDRRRPTWLWNVAHPQQGRYWAVRERLVGTVRKTIWQSHKPIDAWRDHED